MRSLQLTSQRWRSVLLLAGAAVLLCLLLAGNMLAPVPATAQDSFIRVPGDFNTIQAAIDAAPAGAEIRVLGGNYLERLVISKSLTLSGSWVNDFSKQDPKSSPTFIDGSNAGRPLTVLAADIAPSVVMSYFAIIGGNATGLGGTVTPTVAGFPGTVVTTVAPDPEPGTEQAAALRSEFAALAAQGPGSQPAFDAMLARLDTAAAWQEPAWLTTAATAGRSGAAPDGQIDCGGAIYLNGASLHLIMVTIGENVASTTGPGAGGALCAVNVPAGGLVLDKAILAGNVASRSEQGFGGALFFDGGAAPATGALVIMNGRIDQNAASEMGTGYGGGAFIANAPGVRFEGMGIAANYATAKGLHGKGGGVYLTDSPAVTMYMVGFETNAASNIALRGGGQNEEWPIGMGGGLYAERVPDLLITSPAGSDTRTLFVGNQAALSGDGWAGALYVLDSARVHIERTLFQGNWGSIKANGNSDIVSGGAVYLEGASGLRVSDSEFANNQVSALNLGGDRMYGGALYISQSDDMILASNRFHSNAVSTSASGGLTHGGGAAIDRSSFITITANHFAENAADLGLSGAFGGGLYLDSTNDALVEHNLFERNRGGAGAGIGGALVVEQPSAEGGFPGFAAAQGMAANGGAGQVERLVIRANTFLANQAAASPIKGQPNIGGAVALNSIDGLSIANNVLAGNQASAGGAMILLGWDSREFTGTVGLASLANNTLFNNGGSGFYFERWTTPITLTNNIIVSHTAGIELANNPDIGGVTAEARYNLYNANVADSEVGQDCQLIETGKISAPVVFVEPWQNNFALQTSSAAIDAGDPAGVPPAPPVDIDGTGRPFGLRVDVGAYEWHGPLYYNYLPNIFTAACKTLPLEGWALGEPNGTSSTLMHTRDGGLTWSRVFTATEWLSGLAVGDKQHIWVTGSKNTILHSMDGGVTWQKQAVPAVLPAGAGVNRVTAVDARTAWAVATVGADKDNQTGYVLATVDGGATWTVQTTIPTAAGFISWISAADANNLWLAGGRTAALLGRQDGKTADEGAGFIYHSMDGGRTWRDESGVAQDIIIGVDAVSAKVAWAAGRNGVYRTLDGGGTWQFFQLTGGADVNHVDSIGGEHVWASGDNFSVFYTSKGLAQPLQETDWQNRTPLALQGKVSYTVDFVDANNGWIVGGNFGTNPGGVVARTCDGGLSWEYLQIDDLDPIRTIEMIPTN